ncbi:MAG: NAD-dependent protein deacylase [Spirochaetes bacterium]|nr:NAD-dependent protein deacylase [Spirochaetota bacterium]
MEKAAAVLRRAQYPLFLSGAGISAESGVPTFRGTRGAKVGGAMEGLAADRGIDGLWNNYRAEDLATPEAFARDPHLVWGWYNWRKRLIASTQPNAAHFAIHRIAQKLPNLLCATQNVDGLHTLAGLESILEMHGNIYRTRCTQCQSLAIIRDDVTPTTQCGNCQSANLRPDIVWFGEQLPRAVLDSIYARLAVCDAILVVGTSGSVYPAAGFAIEVRRREGVVIEINVEDGHKPYAHDIYLRGKAGEILPQIADLV